MKNYYLTIDTETANGLNDPFVYDIGGAIHDKKGNVYETFSFVIYDIFVTCKDYMNLHTMPIKSLTIRKIWTTATVKWFGFPPQRNISAIFAKNME